MKETIDLLISLEKLHRTYKNPRTNEDLKSRLFNGCSSLFGKLEKVGYPRAFVEALLMYGEEFLDNCEDFAIDETIVGYARMVFSGEWLIYKMAELTGGSGMREAAFWAWKSGYSIDRTRVLLKSFVGKGVISYFDDPDVTRENLWSANLTTRIKYGFAISDSPSSIYAGENSPSRSDSGVTASASGRDSEAKLGT